MPSPCCEASLLVLHAPTAESTFFSLPYIEELLSLYRASVLSSLSSSQGLAAAGTVSSSATRVRLEVEQRLEEHYFSHRPTTTGPDAAAAPSAQPVSQPSGDHGEARVLTLLRYGLARALGFADTTAQETCSLDDQVLGRQRQTFCLPNLDEDSARWANASGYKESGGEDLRQAAFLEWFEDLLGFITARDFSAVQARCVLIDAMGLLESLESLPPDAVAAEADDDVVEMTTLSFLQEAMTAQSCAVPTKVLETTVTRVPVVREVPDPDFIAALEERLLKEKKLTKKQQTAIQAQIAAAPLVPRTSVEEQLADVEREVMVGPYFTWSESAAVLDYLTGSVLGHWRLMHYVMTGEQQRTEAAGGDGALVLLEDVDNHCVPPLQEFFPAAMHDMQATRNALWRETEQTAAALYTDDFLPTLAALGEEEAAARRALLLAKEAAERANRADALSSDDYTRVQRAFDLRLEHWLGGGEAAGAGSDAAPADGAADSAVAVSRLQTSAGAGGKKRSVGGGKPSPLAETAAILPPLLAGEPRVAYESTEPLPKDRPFHLPEVEWRVGAAAASLDGMLADSKAMKKVMRGTAR